MKFEKVSDVLACCEDTDYVRIYYGSEWLLAVGKWYQDHILAKSEKPVKAVRFESVGAFAIWHVQLKGEYDG